MSTASHDERKWANGLAARVALLAALGAGAYTICARAPALIEGTLLAEFPVVATVLALFAYVSLAHAVFDRGRASARIVQGKSALAKA